MRTKNNSQFPFIGSYYQRCQCSPVLCRFRLGKIV